MILADVALLQQQAPSAIRNLHGNCPVQLALAMRGKLRRGANLAIGSIDQDDELVGITFSHGASVSGPENVG